MRSAAALATLALAMVRADDPAGPQCGVTARGVTVCARVKTERYHKARK